jgi:Tol biopolymer transport system component
VLRRALGDDAAKPTYVITVARRGYRFVAPATEWTEPIETPPPSVEPTTESVAESAPIPVAAVSPRTGRTSWTSVLRWTVPVALACLALGWSLGARSAARPSALEPGGTLRFSQDAPPGTSFTSGGALSPDGTRLAFSAEDVVTGRSHLWVRTLDAAAPRKLEGIEGASRPFWSPDSRFIGFVANGRLKTVPVDGGTPTDVASVGSRPAGAAWSPRGQIVFSTWLAGFSAVSASGGAVTSVTTLEGDESAHAWPQFLPDGDHFLFSIYGGEHRGIFVGRLSTGERRRILDADGGAIYSPLGYLVFTRGGVLTAQPFDASTLTVTGEPFNIASGHIESPSMTNGTILSSAGGLLAVGGASGESELSWFDRTGRRFGTVDARVQLHNPVLSHDEQRVYGNTFPPSPPGVWVVDLQRGATSRVTSNGGMPVLAPDDKTLAFTATRDGRAGLFAVDLATSRDVDNALLVSDTRKTPVQFIGNGQDLLFYTSTPGSQGLWLLSLSGNRDARPLRRTTANEIQGRLSPDGRWLAYASDESGTWEVYVRSFPDSMSRVTVSIAGGAEPFWRGDGRELYYLAADHAIMAVDVTPGARLGLGRPRVLFRPRLVGGPATYRSHYTVTADGQRFLVDVLREPALDPVTLLLNWARPRR